MIKSLGVCGDGEMDEPELAIHLAGRKLSNLIYVVNCNLQDWMAVRGNGKAQEMDAHFGSSGWYVIKVIWNSYWDELFQR